MINQASRVLSRQTFLNKAIDDSKYHGELFVEQRGFFSSEGTEDEVGIVHPFAQRSMCLCAIEQWLPICCDTDLTPLLPASRRRDGA